MADPRVNQLARVLVRHSRKVRRGQKVLVVGPVAAEPLILGIGREVLRAGGHPMYRMAPDRAAEVFYAEASKAQLQFLPKSVMAAAREADHYIRVMGSVNTKSLTGVDPKKQVLVQATNRRFLDYVLEKNEWTLTLYPTDAYAQDGGMSREEFEDFVFAACYLDKRDPVAEWKKAKAFQERVLRRLRRAKTVRIVAPDTDLTLRVGGRKWMNSCGSHNMPDGEVFTGPVETSAEGHVRYTYPCCDRGKEVEDVRLEFEKGKAVKATAARNQAFLRQMIAADAGACRLGELGIGTNYGIGRFVKNILFDEKIGGTVHLALGRSYSETGGRNKSAIHWDMICDLRRGGRLEVDGKVLQADGKFRL